MSRRLPTGKDIYKLNFFQQLSGLCRVLTEFNTPKLVPVWILNVFVQLNQCFFILDLCSI